MPKGPTVTDNFSTRISRENVAREQFLQRFYPTMPATYRALCPVTNKVAELLAWGEWIEKIMLADHAAIRADQESPYDPIDYDAATTALDWDGVPGTTSFTLYLKMPAVVPGLPRIKSGSGVDPADGQAKPFVLFRRVRDDAYRIGVGECWEIEARYQGKLDQWVKERDAGNEANAQTLKDEAQSILDERSNWVRAWELRNARHGTNGV
jgi:hypothetical protein